MKALQELLWTLLDAARCGDLLGHWRAWRRVVTGQVDESAQVVLTGRATESALPESPRAAGTPETQTI